MRHKSMILVLAAILVAAAGCSTEKTALRQIQPGATVYIDGWDQDGDRGDQALVEQKPSGMWVVPVDAPFRTRRVGEFTVRITLDPRRGFVITDLGGVKVGRDRDDCLEVGETYVFLDVPESSLSWEAQVAGDGAADDDCHVTGTG
ncbi:hypothetical protein [Thermomonospora curvata]|uniref:Lipoprotein n=1 Tax=Thermomonospora curvata (strain ATCC 19995 / DSM 43183 / JCM 3096 / KCTC 9072 / NBRC 15933 / NCIMB 10081 / Henssen B9) TaxID=471852 RepID=D1AD19_THECD|nr:hypothetical protein [Thermomonospora curvata]ACY99328.1 hypothetical protein Tcur_3797 [Thermomonospora curvata DSM 43183]